MADQKPPRLDGDERETLLALLQYQRESLVRKIEGLDEEAARRRLVPSGTSLIWLVEHLASAEAIWVVHRFAGREGTSGTARHDTVASAVDAYRAAWVVTDAIVAEASLDDLCRRGEAEPPVNLRWVLAHLLEETARHAGHADILRELIDGTTGR